MSSREYPQVHKALAAGFIDLDKLFSEVIGCLVFDSGNLSLPVYP